MRTLSVLALMACLCACGDPEPAKTLDASRELRPHINKVFDAWSSLDVAKVAPFYAKETGRAFYEITPLKFSSWAETAAGYKAMTAGVKSVKVEISPDFQAHSNGPIAWVTFTGNFVVGMNDGKTNTSKARVTQILQKDKDSWLIIHEHVSMPMMEQAPPPPAAKKAPAKKKASKKRR